MKQSNVPAIMGPEQEIIPKGEGLYKVEIWSHHVKVELRWANSMAEILKIADEGLESRNFCTGHVFNRDETLAFSETDIDKIWLSRL